MGLLEGIRQLQKDTNIVAVENTYRANMNYLDNEVFKLKRAIKSLKQDLEIIRLTPDWGKNQFHKQWYLDVSKKIMKYEDLITKHSLQCLHLRSLLEK